MKLSIIDIFVSIILMKLCLIDMKKTIVLGFTVTVNYSFTMCFGETHFKHLSNLVSLTSQLCEFEVLALCFCWVSPYLPD